MLSGEDIVSELSLPVDEKNKVLDINGKPIAFANNPDLLPANAQLPLTKKHLEEIVKCSEDIMYFLETYVQIFSLDEGWVKLNLRSYQKEIIKNYKKCRFNQIMAGRQSGKSTTILLCILWDVIFHSDTVVGFCAHKQSMVQENMVKFQDYFKALPLWLKPGVKRWHQTYMILDNGSKVYISTATPDAFRGLGIKILFIDECVSGDTIVTIRENGEVKDIPIRELYNKIHHQKREDTNFGSLES